MLDVRARDSDSTHRFWNREITEDQLGSTISLRAVVEPADPLNHRIYLVNRQLFKLWTDKAHVERCLPPIRRDLQHVIFRWIHTPAAHPLASARQLSDILDELRARFDGDRDRASSNKAGAR